MTDNPYAGDYDNGYGPEAAPRTSILAVSSFVMSLLCCIPFVPLLGAALGVGALIGIGGSNGRVSGRGLAMAGVIIGVLITVAQGTVFFMGKQAMGMASQALYGSMDQYMTEIEAGDFDAAKALIVGGASSIDDERYAAFRDGYRAEYGSFVEIPTGWGEIFNGYAEIGQQIQPYQGRQNFIPIPALFDSGRVLMIAIVDQNGGTSTGAASPIPIADVWIVLPDGSEIRLSGTGGAAPATPGTDPAADAPGEPGDEPQPEPVPDTPDDDGP